MPAPTTPTTSVIAAPRRVMSSRPAAASTAMTAPIPRAATVAKKGPTITGMIATMPWAVSATVAPVPGRNAATSPSPTIATAVAKRIARPVRRRRRSTGSWTGRAR